MSFPALLRDFNDDDIYRKYVEETREQYLSEMLDLLDSIRVPKILTWISHTPPPHILESDPYFPHFVDLHMVAQFRRQTQGYVEYVGEKADFRHYYPSQRVHTGVSILLHRTLIENQYIKPKHVIKLPPRRRRRIVNFLAPLSWIVPGPIR